MPFTVLKSFVIEGDVVKAFDVARAFFKTLGYNVQSIIRPTLLVLKRRGIFQSSLSSKTERYMVNLRISFTPVGDLQMYSTALNTVRCEYTVSVAGKRVTSIDRATLNSEMEQLKSHFTESLKPTSDVTTLRCENCGAILELDVTLCQSCGQDARLESIPIKVKERDDVTPMLSTVEFEPNRVQMGCRSVDQLLYGGLPERYAVILTSPSCDEKDLLVIRFLTEGVKQGDATLYVSTDVNKVLELISDYPSMFFAILCNPQADLLVQENQENIFKVNAVDNLSGINIAIISAIGKLFEESGKTRRIILSNVSDILLALSARTTRKWLLDLVSKLKANGFTILATLNPEMHQKEDANAIIDLFDGHIALYAKESVQGSQLHLCIRKMYNKKFSTKEIPFTRALLAD